MQVIGKRPILASEAWFYAGLTLFAAALTAFVFPVYVALLFWLIFAFVLQFFQDLHRPILQDNDVIIAPADGEMIFTGVDDDPYLDRKAFNISVFMNVFSVHSNRAPFAGTVKKMWFQSGLFVNIALDKASLENEGNTVWFHAEAGLTLHRFSLLV